MLNIQLILFSIQIASIIQIDIRRRKGYRAGGPVRQRIQNKRLQEAIEFEGMQNGTGKGS